MHLDRFRCRLDPREFARMSDSSPQRPYLQFGTRSLLALTLIFAVLFSLANWVGAIWALVVGWFALMIGAHVLGNSWGRSNYQEKERDPINEPPQPARDDAPMVIAQMQQQTVERLAKIRLNRVVLGVSLLGLLGGAAVGLALGWQEYASGDPRALNGLVLGTISTAILGAFLGFWCSSFLSIFCGFGRAGLEGSAPHHRTTGEPHQATKVH